MNENSTPPPSCRYPRPCAHECCDERYKTVTITLGRKP